MWLQGLVFGVLVVLSPPTAVLLGVLLMPSLTIMFADRSPGKPVARAVLLYGLAAAALPVMDLWNDAHGMDESLALASNTHVLAIAWAAQAAGWLMAELLPLLVGLVLDVSAAAETATLKRERAALAANWDGDGAQAQADQAIR
jgi:hypothetical protein